MDIEKSVTRWFHGMYSEFYFPLDKYNPELAFEVRLFVRKYGIDDLIEVLKKEYGNYGINDPVEAVIQVMRNLGTLYVPKQNGGRFRIVF